MTLPPVGSLVRYRRICWALNADRKFVPAPDVQQTGVIVERVGDSGVECFNVMTSTGFEWVPVANVIEVIV